LRDQWEEVGPDYVRHAANLGEDPLNLDDALVLAWGKLQQPFGGPVARREFHPHQRVSHPWSARIVWQRLAELV
jgi:hypothetical protein